MLTVVTITSRHPESGHGFGKSMRGEVFISSGIMNRFALDAGDQVSAILVPSRGPDCRLRAIRVYTSRCHPGANDRVKMVWEPETSRYFPIVKRIMVGEEEGPYTPEEVADFVAEELHDPSIHPDALLYEVTLCLDYLAENGWLFETRVFHPGKMHVQARYFARHLDMLLPGDLLEASAGDGAEDRDQACA